MVIKNQWEIFHKNFEIQLNPPFRVPCYVRAPLKCIETSSIYVRKIALVDWMPVFLIVHTNLIF